MSLWAAIRGLTSGEQGLAVSVFGRAVRLETVRFVKSPWPFDRAFVAGRWFGRDWIVWPGRGLPDDFAVAPLAVQAVFIHELVHVWQAQTGVNLLAAKLRAGDSAASYRYPIDHGCDWSCLNIEQQAMMVEHRFRLSRGGAVPAGPRFYADRLPFRP
ncbi:hypothetical protein [Brevundimonas variabilis]|uniref:Vgr related protein n=1 Tax=Brevundimonas variabilis TaxID=74312 RepID=A0A7W9CHL7_9CAUL|nr:hypothetical protein [Brevundimonas variabilis]MBB5745382.1 hypothetical protein [Brevundimonas variabilis]